MKKIKLLAGLAVAVTAISALTIPVSADKWVETPKGYVYEFYNGQRAEKGWLELDETYYIQSDGTRKTGMLETKSGKKYYFDQNGVLCKNKWITFKNGDKYFFGSDGVASTGFKKISEDTYYFTSEGKMKTGWVKSNDKKYYFKQNGKMAKNCTMKIGEKTYSFDKNGVGKVANSKKKAKLKNFVEPYMGEHSSVTLENCGITNYCEFKDYPNTDYDYLLNIAYEGSPREKESKDNAYFGDVSFLGIDSKILLRFNSSDELYEYSIVMPLEYKKQLSLLQNFSKEFSGSMNKSKTSFKYMDYDSTVRCFNCGKKPEAFNMTMFNATYAIR